MLLLATPHSWLPFESIKPASLSSYRVYYNVRYHVDPERVFFRIIRCISQT